MMERRTITILDGEAYLYAVYHSLLDTLRSEDVELKKPLNSNLPQQEFVYSRASNNLMG